MLFHLQVATGAIRSECRQLAALFESLRKIRVQLCQNFPAPSLRAQYASDVDELAGYSTISN
jgi:hypothetical protein